MQKNWLPDYIDQLPTLKFLDPLGALLTGTIDPAPVEYHFADVVKQSGHACPTIAGAYGLVLEAMADLYGDDEVPVRGQIAVVCPQSPTEGAMGPLSQAISYLTGAAAENGFQGLGGQHVRRGLLSFSGQQTPFLFSRLDNGRKTALAYHAERIPGDPQMGALMQKTLSGQASDEERARFGELWQQRVHYVLTHREELFERIPRD